MVDPKDKDETSGPTWVVCMTGIGVPDTDVYGPFTSPDEAREQAEQWRAIDGEDWAYRVHELMPTSHWEAL